MKLKTKFQDEDFDLGEVVEADIYVFHGGDNKLKVEACAAKGGYHTFYLDSLKELTDMFEDYEEPENFYIVEQRGTVGSRFRTGDEYEKMFKEIGNYFESKEEAEKAAERLRAWKRLKDKGFRFAGYELVEGKIRFVLDLRPFTPDDLFPDLDLLFGGEE